MNAASRTSLLFAIALGISGSACAQGYGGTDDSTAPSGGVTLGVKFPAEVTLNRQPVSDQRQTEEATFTLTNTMNKDVTLEASNDCTSHTWYITDTGGQMVDDETMCPMIYEPVSRTLKPGESYSDTRQVTLIKVKYADGAKYTLHVSFWTIAGETTFTAKVVQ
ncbi:MAG: hypothetical protein HY243_10830 [Proteobacteria bacterium]|nr:hypothetical protein [Pseudomonadota bacterium]